MTAVLPFGLCLLLVTRLYHAFIKEGSGPESLCSATASIFPFAIPSPGRYAPNLKPSS